MIIEELNKDSLQYKKDLEVINRFIHSKKLNSDTQSKIRGFIEYLYQDSKQINNDT